MIFRRALIRLTLTYTLVQLALFGGFAVGIYAYVTGAFDFDAAESDGGASINIAEQGFANLRVGLIVGYGILVVLLPLSSFLMARAALAPIRRSFELQQGFVDGASHEFRTPLSVVQGELELALSRARTPAQYRAAMTSSLDAVGGLIRLTNDLLLLTRGNTVELEATFEPLCLEQIVGDAVRTRRVPEGRITVGASETIRVLGSRELIDRAIGNVLDNALKFTTAQQAISITTFVVGKYAQLGIQDSGSGMTRVEVEHAFDRFWRAHDAHTTPGYGLGLPLVEQICAAHHATVAMTSTPGVGTRVVLSFPVLPL